MEGWKEGREGKRRKGGKKIDKKERREDGKEEGRKEFMRIKDQSGQWAVGRGQWAVKVLGYCDWTWLGERHRVV